MKNKVIYSYEILIIFLYVFLEGEMVKVDFFQKDLFDSGINIF